MTILDKAKEVVFGDRHSFYGHPADNHGLTAALWDVYVRELYKRGKKIGAREVCWLNIFQKASRDMNLPKEDNEVDTAGYAENMELIRDRENGGSHDTTG